MELARLEPATSEYRPRIDRRRFTCGLALAVACVGPAAGAGARQFDFGGFGLSANVPPGFRIKASDDFFRTFFMWHDRGASVGEVGVDRAGISRKPGTALTVGVELVPRVRGALLRQTVPRKPAVLARLLVGVPRAARVVIGGRVRRASLRGTSAATRRFAYLYHGRRIIQRDIVARVKSRVYVIEVDSDRAYHRYGARALRDLLRSWRWIEYAGD